MKKTSIAMALAIACGTCFGVANAQTSGMSNTSATTAEFNDSRFIQDANSANVAQIMLGRTAASKAVNSGVRALAEAVVSSHVKANDALKLLAGSRKVDLPGKPDSSQQSEVDELTAKRGADADHLYVTDVLRDSEQLIASYEDAQSHSPDPDVRKHAAIMLPALRDHHERAKDILATQI